MSDDQTAMVVLAILSFFAGFACAIWLAITMDKDAREMTEGAQEDNIPNG